MEIEEIEEKSPLLRAVLAGAMKKDANYKQIEDYVLETLEIDKGSIEEPELFHKNFVHLMCHLYKDIKEIEDRLKEYRSRYTAIQNAKENEANFEQRKLIYFCGLNKRALAEINEFITNGIPEFLLDLRYDALGRECERDGLSDLYFRRRYKYAWHRDYYSIDYPFGIVAKVSQYTKEKFEFTQTLEQEQRLLKTYTDAPEQFWRVMDRYVEQDDVMGNILSRVSNNYHLKKRQEIFETLTELFTEKKYQSFITLGLIQIEGLFDDYCQIRFGESQNQGTLVEKAQKTLETNEYNLMRLYPYFAFDIPLLRNEAAHKGMLKAEDLQRTAYNLVLDLNTLSQMVKSESYDKFVYAIMTHEELLKWEPKTDGGTDELYDTLLHELFMFDKMANDHFWKVMRNPADYQDEIEFYRIDDLPEGMVDLPGIVSAISQLIGNEGFWKAMHRLVQKSITPFSRNLDVEDFAKRMKDQYIGILAEPAKSECIEVAKLLKTVHSAVIVAS